MGKRKIRSFYNQIRIVYDTHIIRILLKNIWYAGTHQSWRSSYMACIERASVMSLINFWCYCQSLTGHPFLADCLNALVQVQNKSLNCLAQLGAKQPTRINKNPQGNHHNHTRTAIGAPNNITSCTAPKIRMHKYTTLITNGGNWKTKIAEHLRL